MVTLFKIINVACIVGLVLLAVDALVAWAGDEYRHWTRNRK